MIPFLVKYSTDFDPNIGGRAVVYAEDEQEAYLASEDYYYDKICDEVEEALGEWANFSTDIDIREFNNIEDGDIRNYAAIN